MRFLYIFPHPDDESFGPAAVMVQQLKAGHEVHLLTLTKGGATKERFRLGLSVEEMGEIRYQEMLEVEKVLQLSSMTVMDLPDSGLAHIDPREIEKTICAYIQQLQPNIIVSYPVHGISGFHDHLVTHAIIKRVYLEMRDQGASYLKRLAFFTVKDNGEPTFQNGKIRLRTSHPDLIDCEIKLGEKDWEIFNKALACYGTYQQTIEDSGFKQKMGNIAYFEIFQEDFSPPLDDLSLQIPS